MSQIHRGLDASRRQPVRPRWRQCQSTPEGSRLIAEAWSVVRVEFRRALALRSEIRQKPGVTEVRMWGAYEKVSVRRV